MESKLDPTTLTISKALDELSTKSLSINDLLEACLERIDVLNTHLNAFITINSEEAREGAEHLLKKGGAGLPLYGIPIAIKDLYETKGILTTAGTPFFENYIPEADCFVVMRLKNAGAIITGKTNTHEIALGVTGVNPHYGICHNPWDVNRISGGSSSGSTVAVATGMSLGALGTDTGGSIRIPASLCGIVGLKPTYGRVSLRGIVPLSWNLDHAGPLAKSVKDAAVILQVIAGYDALDPASADVPVGDYLSALTESLQGWKIIHAAGTYVEETNSEVLSAVDESARVFRSLGAEVTKMDMEFLGDMALANGKMVQADAAAFHRERLSKHPDWFGADVRERLDSGRSITSTDYILARRTQSEGRRKLEEILKEFDLVILPTTPITAPLIEGTDAIEQARRLTRFTAPFNLAGLPALSLPCGFDSSGLPIGLQLVSGACMEEKIIGAGHAFESATPWHLRKPKI